MARKFLICTNHSALCWLLEFRHPEGQVARWIESLQQYDYHRTPTWFSHSNADALSRQPCWGDTCNRLEMQEGLKMSPEEALMQNPTQLPDTSHHILPVAALNLILGAAGNRSSKELRQAQLNDREIKHRRDPPGRRSLHTMTPLRSTVLNGKASDSSMVYCIDPGRLHLGMPLSSS